MCALPVMPPSDSFRDATRVFVEAMESETRESVQKAGRALLDVLAKTYEVRRPPLGVLGVRPRHTHDDHFSYELFGDYTLETQRIRIWMRTAVLGKVTSAKGLLSTLLHEFCHHLDIKKLGFEDTPHTRGFYARIDSLYHAALGTPDTARKPLSWRRAGPIYRIDWAKMRAYRPR
jgi:hypothetical protein